MMAETPAEKVPPLTAAEWVERGLAARASGDHAAALTAFEQALVLVPDHPLIPIDIANAMVELGRTAESLRMLEAHVERHPEAVHAHVGIGHHARRAGSHEAALAHFRRALELEPTHPSIPMDVALGEEIVGRPRDALATLETALKYHPESALLRRQILRLQRQADDAPPECGRDSGVKEALLTFAGVHAHFARREVLRDVSFHITPGISTGMVGANGAGKSTLLRLALDLVTPSRGSITLKGHAARHPASRQHLAYLPERFSSPHFLTGHELLAGLLALHGISYSQESANSECRKLGLPPSVLHDRARTYSKGMHQCLGLVGCLLTQREFLILDEPFSGLDPVTADRFCARLKEAQRQGVTLFFSSHDMGSLEELCERVILLKHGEIAFEGAPSALSARYPGPSSA